MENACREVTQPVAGGAGLGGVVGCRGRFWAIFDQNGLSSENAQK
eukprot:COSAG02_NODE_27730_length_603_cov_2.742063_1_plen_44_part_10